MNKVLVPIAIISMTVVYVFIAYNVFMGLLYSTALQGFCGILLLIIGLVVLVFASINVHKVID